MRRADRDLSLQHPVTAHTNVGGTEKEPRVAHTNPAAQPSPAIPFTEAPGLKGSLCCGSIVLDCDRYTVQVEERMIRLTRLEFDLLEFLARHPDRVVSHADLMRNVVGRALGDGASVVRVHVSHIREKLGHVGAAIRTVRGRGLLFDPHFDRRPSS